MEKGARVDAVNHIYSTPLHFAVDAGDAVIAKLLLENSACIDAPDICYSSPCMLAASALKPDAFDVLSKRGANVRLFDQIRQTILHHAASNGGTPQLASGIIDATHWWGPEYEDTGGQSIISLALWYGEMTQVSFMLNLAPKHGAWEPHRSNVLTAAVQNGFALILKQVLKRLPPDLIPKLLAHQAVIGRIPLYAACTTASPLFENDAINMLLDAGADLEHEGGDEGTPLVEACATGRFAVVKLLVSNGAKLYYEKDGHSISALYARNNFQRSDYGCWLRGCGS